MANAKPVNMDPVAPVVKPLNKTPIKIKSANEMRDEDGNALRGTYELPNGTIRTQN
jgi:hypothetical protein